MKRRIKINGIIIFTVFLLSAIFSNIFLRNDKGSSFNVVAKVCAIGFILLGQMLRVSARGYKSEHSQNGEALIQGGPYELVRNPMYLGILLIGLGIIAMLFKWWVGFIFLIVFSVRYPPLIFAEEKKLSALFLERYRDYSRRVPRLLPSISAIIKTDVREYLPIKLPWLKKEISSILAVWILVIFLCFR